MDSRLITRGIVGLAAIISLFLAGDIPAGMGPQPGATDEYVSLNEAMSTVREGDIENPRTTDPRRKASEDKWPGLGWQTERAPSSLYEMEDIVWPHFDGWTFPDDDYPEWSPDPYTGQYVGSNPTGGGSPGGGADWRVCRPEAGGFYIECGTCKNWEIKQPDTDIVEVTKVSGQGDAWLETPNDTIKVCAYAGAEDGQLIVVGYTQIPIVGGKEFPPVYCEKTFIIQCDECECIDAVPPIYGESAIIHQDGSGDNTVNVWVGSSLACGPFSWAIAGTGAHFNSVGGPTSETTEEELEVVTVVADNAACGSFTIVVTDSCGVSSTAYLRVEEDSEWVNISSDDCADGCTCEDPGVAELVVEYDTRRWYSYRTLGKYQWRQNTRWACTSAVYNCSHSWWDSHCLNANDPDVREPCITSDADYKVPCYNQPAGGAIIYNRANMTKFEWVCK